MHTRISPALVVASIALAVALGGVSYAAVTLPKNSVGTKQLKKNAVTGKKVKDKSLSAADIKQGSLAFGNAVNVSGLAFQGRSDGTTLSGTASGCVVKTGDDWVIAPVSLPQGARVTKVEFYVIDNAVPDVLLAFSRMQPSGGVSADLESGMTNGNEGTLRAFPFSGSPITVVDNTNFTYLVQVFLQDPVLHSLCGARVEYELQ